eukprot:augustus_masked-scaffold_29-processed-gene-1.14-mRNA-1 protein AED:0.13 eAED:0.14 QI:0/-1/0/1/-1/1/1/0/486
MASVATHATKETYKSLELKEIKLHLEEIINSTSKLLNISTSKSTLLLLLHNFETSDLINKFYADETVLQNLSFDEEKISSVSKKNSISSNPCEAKIICPILLEEIDLSCCFSLGCSTNNKQHYFSLAAWKEYLKSQLLNNPKSVLTKCPAPKCASLVPPSLFEALLPEHLVTRYNNFLLDAFVDRSRNMVWCPGSPLANISEHAVMNMKPDDGKLPRVLCSLCKITFCFDCGSDVHQPLACKLLQVWLDKCQNESETANWILANTKTCPKCSVRIEKNQGCNHMKCLKCGYEYCWHCSKPWKSHGGDAYKCNKFNEEESPESQSAAEKAKSELNRYLHYYKRFAEHGRSLQFADKQKKEVEDRMARLQDEHGTGWQEVEYLGAAATQLVENRQVLRYTYALAYYLPNIPIKHLFEDLQSQLEVFTEGLSGMIEQNGDDGKVLQKKDVVNYTRVTRDFMNKLLEAVKQEDIGEIAWSEMERKAMDAR